MKSDFNPALSPAPMIARPALCALCAILVCATAWAENPARIAASPPPEGQRVARVELRLPEGMDSADFAPLVSIRPGDRLTRREVRRTLDLIFATGLVADVRAIQSNGPDGCDLAFDIAPRRFIAADHIAFTGNERLDETALHKAIELDADRFEYFPENLERLFGALRARYARVGFNGVRIDHALSVDEDGAERLTIAIDEGSP
ncbi:MAG: hypothetical protein IJC63_03115 [Myxococcaceae bacterium]|nr:hypothetical protein [Myxococcaceae bacterium]